MQEHVHSETQKYLHYGLLGFLHMIWEQ